MNGLEAAIVGLTVGGMIGIGIVLGVILYAIVRSFWMPRHL